MGDAVNELKEDVARLQTKMDNVAVAIADLRVLIAGNYVTKEDFDKCKDCSEDRIVALHEKVDGLTTKLLAYATFICVVIGVIFNLVN